MTKEDLLDLQSQRDSLRARFKNNLNDKDLEKELYHLDQLFFRLVRKNNFILTKFGRLV